MNEKPLFDKATITYNGQRIFLSESALYLDAGLDSAAITGNPYAFNDIGALFATINIWEKTTTAPITVYIAPHVYWIDNPDATDTVQCREGEPMPFGVRVECDALRLVGLCDNPRDVVLAGNRGQSHGANGNYTMFCFKVRDLELKNLTIGNYCSVDLIYPKNSRLSRKRRTDTITQAQLGWQRGDKLWASNCNFISRLNLLPVCGGERCLYENCHFESTDDALNGKAVYLNCDFDFYGNRPFYSTRESGAVFLNCLFRSRILAESVERTQYFTKEGGAVTVVDCEYQRVAEESESEAGFAIAWTKYPHPSLKCYQSHVRYNGAPVIVAGENALETIHMEGKEIEKAYRLEKDGRIIYNIYNLLRGKDEWDPMQVKEIVKKAGKETIPTFLKIKTSTEHAETLGYKESMQLEAKAFYFYGEPAEDVSISFYIEEADKPYVQITDKGNGICLVENVSEEPLTKKVIVHAQTSQGLEVAVRLKCLPQLLEAPVFLKLPQVEIEQGLARVSYEADLADYKELSLISWYRCEDEKGKGAVLVAVSRDGIPLKEYSLTRADVGYYLMVQVELAHSCSHCGEGVRAVSKIRVSSQDVASINDNNIHRSNSGKLVHTDGTDYAYTFTTDFSTFPTSTQDKIIPGFWTVDQYRPKDTQNFGKWDNTQNPEPWKYGETGNGSVGKGLYQNVQGARLMYTPLKGSYGDMTLSIKLDPAKTAGQGFGSADQYMDICIKFDTETLAGVGVRILRSAEASDGVRFLFIKYENGETTYLNEGILTSCFLTGCEIRLAVKENNLSVHAQSRTIKANGSEAKYASAVDMEVRISETSFGGVAIQHTGTPGSGGWQNTIMLHDLEIEWKEL